MIAVIVVAGLLALLGLHELVRWAMARRGTLGLAYVLATIATYLGVAVIAVAMYSCYGTRPTRTATIDHFATGNRDAVEKLQRGDVILAADGKDIDIDRLPRYVTEQGGKPIRLTIERDGVRQDVTVQPAFHQKSQRWVLGFVMDQTPTSMSFGEALGKGVVFPVAHLGVAVQAWTQTDDDADPGGPTRLLSEVMYEVKRPMLSHALAWLGHFGSLLMIALIPVDALRYWLTRRKQRRA